MSLILALMGEPPSDARAEENIVGSWSIEVACSWGAQTYALDISDATGAETFNGSINGTVYAGRRSGDNVSFESSNFLNTARYQGSVQSPMRMAGTYTQTLSSETCRWTATRIGAPPASSDSESTQGWGKVEASDSGGKSSSPGDDKSKSAKGRACKKLKEPSPPPGFKMVKGEGCVSVDELNTSSYAMNKGLLKNADRNDFDWILEVFLRDKCHGAVQAFTCIQTRSLDEHCQRTLLNGAVPNLAHFSMSANCPTPLKVGLMVCDVATRTCTLTHATAR